MMHHLFRQRPTPSPQPGRINYVLQRFGGLEVYVPQFTAEESLRAHSGRGAALVVPTSTSPRALQIGPGCADIDNNQIRDPHEFLGWPTAAVNVKPCGQYTPLFGGRIVLGPGRIIFLAFALYFVALLVQIILEKDLVYRYCGGLPLYILGNVLAVGNLLSFLTVGLSDPGVVPKNYTVQELMAETEEYRARHPVARFYRYCSKCRVCRPPRVFHCGKCEVCIRHHDIHFVIAGKCIGERNRRSFFSTVLLQTLQGIYMLAINVFISCNLNKHLDSFIPDVLLTVSSLVTGLSLLLLPQSGIFMCVYKIYLLWVGRTAREDYRKHRILFIEECVDDQYPVWINIRDYFFRASQPSVFRGNVNRIADVENLPADIPTPWVLQQEIRGRRRTQSSLLQLRDGQIISPPRHVYEDLEVDEEDDVNGNATAHHEALRLRQLADDARGKLTPSVPLLEQTLNTGTRIKMPRRSKPSAVLQQKISAFHATSKMAKATVSYHKQHFIPRTLSDGCIPRTQNGVPEMIQLSRATQLRRIIQMILLRDRQGLIEMSNRVNIAALIGMNRFDPDNLQLLELNNGLPMIAPRRREPEVPNHRLGAGVLGIPQMVAAGLLPTARDIAHSVESMVGRGRVRRLPPVGRQRYTPITVIGPPIVPALSNSPRRVLHVDEMEQLQLRQQMSRNPFQNLTPNGRREPVTTSSNEDVVNDPSSQPQTPIPPPAPPPSTQETRIYPEQEYMDDNNNDDEGLIDTLPL